MGPRPPRTPMLVLANTSITRRDTNSRNLLAQRRCTVNTPKHPTPMQLLSLTLPDAALYRPAIDTHRNPPAKRRGAMLECQRSCFFVSDYRTLTLDSHCYHQNNCPTRYSSGQQRIIPSFTGTWARCLGRKQRRITIYARCS